MRRLTPHLGNLLSANQFFDTLSRREVFFAAAFCVALQQSACQAMRPAATRERAGGS